ncbi:MULTISPECIES: hypothetical protein [unclassified Streptomyces]|uniref:hypothetical protein n=1 Tax=unclassified Streptomyces TaxID=2593676 RepID=UPI0024746982|nr:MULTISPECIES: hypothetical protein [unclassified Streptomyces]MDH6450468.1 hypothetical protein [Streptomyces sp. SAI-119]MDH6498988.1 hypothetical protein [Streptomyces sp. SAI-149]
MSDATGTVISGVIAFAAAVIGAVIAGRYAKRGAETGGRKAVEAALTQVHGQAAAEHWQWVRSQRHQSFAALLAAYAALDEVLARIEPEVRSGTGLDEPAGREMQERALELQAKTSQLALWGPSEANSLAYVITGKSVAAMRTLLHIESMSSSGASADWSSFERARSEMVQAHATFLHRAGEIIRDPRQPVG